MFKKVIAKKNRRKRKKHEDKTNSRQIYTENETERKREARSGKKIKNNIPENRSCPASRPHPVRRGIKN